MRFRFWSLLSLALILVLGVLWIGCSSETDRHSSADALIGPDFDTSYVAQESLPDSAWETYSLLWEEDDPQTGDDGAIGDDETYPLDKSGEEIDDGNNPKGTKPQV